VSVCVIELMCVAIDVAAMVDTYYSKVSPTVVFRWGRG
jgi:hypothetical protein